MWRSTIIVDDGFRGFDETGVETGSNQGIGEEHKTLGSVSEVCIIINRIQSVPVRQPYSFLCHSRTLEPYTYHLPQDRNTPIV